MPEFEEKIFDPHAERRTQAVSRCFERGYHLGPNSDGQCLDCGRRGGIPFRAEIDALPPRLVYTKLPDVVAHNPNATYEELMAERAMTPEQHRAAQKARAEKIAAGPVSDTVAEELPPATPAVDTKITIDSSVPNGTTRPDFTAPAVEVEAEAVEAEREAELDNENSEASKEAQ